MATTTTLGPLDVEGIDFAFGDQPDLHATLARLRARKPYAIVTFATVPGVLLLADELVRAAFKDEETFPAHAVYSMTTEATFGRSILCMTGAEHRANRTIVSAPLRRRRVEQYLEPIIKPVINELIDRFAHRGTADLVAEFTHRYSLLITSRMLGLRVNDEADIHRWAQGLIHYPLDPDGATQAAREFTEYVTPIIAQRRRNPGDDLISMLVTERNDDGATLTDDEILTFLRMLFPLGADTTMLALGNTLSALLNHPDQLELLLSDPDAYLKPAVWEGMRWESPVALLPRACPQAVSWHGIDIPAFTPMIFAITAANRDPVTYPEPDAFDITRNVMPTLSFGQGPHSCIGNWLAESELVTALGALLRRLPDLTLDPRHREMSKVTSQVGTALRGPNALHVTYAPDKTHRVS
ncbi:MAG: cytochrome P450 [Mycobacterium sp.]|nr:cytochrome P450 [Mycobacterium sp.]